MLIKLRAKPHSDGCIFALYLVLYSFFRFFVEYLRADNPLVLFGLTLAQLISIGVFVCGAGLYVFLRYGRNKI